MHVVLSALRGDASYHTWFIPGDKHCPVISGLFTVMPGAGTSNKNKQYGPFSLLPKNPAFQEVDDLSLDQDCPYFILRHNSAMIPFHMFRPVKLSELR